MILAAAQTAIRPSLRANLSKLQSVMKDAADLGVELLLTPEMVLSGYDKSVLGDPNYCAELAESLDLLAEASAKHRMALVVGHGIQTEDGWRNRASVLLPDGQRVHYDKIHVTEAEQRIFTSGREPLVVPVGERQVGVMICRDQDDPQLARALCDQGAELLLYLSAHLYTPSEARWKLEKNLALPIARAVENRMPVLMCNAVGTHKGYISLGRSVAVNAHGCVLALAGEADECLLCVDM